MQSLLSHPEQRWRLMLPGVWLILSLGTLMTSAELPDFDALWDYNDPAATERRFLALLPHAEATADLSYRAQLLTQIARAQGLGRRFHEAHATLDGVESMLGQGELPPVVHARYRLERGRVFNSAGQREAARPLFQQAWEVASSGRLDHHAIDAAHMLAIVEPDSWKQFEWNRRALELAERSIDARARRWRASLYNNVGWTHFERQHYDEALEAFEKAVALRAEQKQPRELRIARYCIAKTLRMQGKIEPAMKISRDLVSESDLAGEPDGFFHEELAECLLVAGRESEAAVHFRRAHEELSRDAWLAQNEPARLERMKQLGR